MNVFCGTLARPGNADFYGYYDLRGFKHHKRAAKPINPVSV
jgi:hypothetical protein